MINQIRILWVSPTLPIPVSAGNRRHLNYLISFAKRNNAIIDFVLYGFEQEAAIHRKELESMFNRFINIPQPSEKIKSFDDYYGIDDWVSDELLETVSTFAKDGVYHVVVTEYVWLSKVLKLFTDKVVKVIDTHDVFSDRDKLLASQGIKKNWFYTRENQEVIGLRRSDIVLGITSDDCNYFKKILSRENHKTKVLPCGTGINSRYESRNNIGDSNLSIGYIASSNSINKESAKRFFDTLNFYNTKIAKCHFNIGGQISSHIGSYENIQIFKKGYIKDIDRFYEDVDVVIAPMVEGTGLKIKTIEAIEYFKPLMSTKQATNDIPISSLWHKFDSVESFATNLGRWLTDPNGDVKRIETIQYLYNQTKNLNNQLCKRQKSFEEDVWRELKSAVDFKAAIQLPQLEGNFLNERLDIASDDFDSWQSKENKVSFAVSIIIPAYNTANYIARCLDSIVSDELGDFEIIVVDDGSTDGTYEIVKEYAERYKSIKLIQQDNSGQGVARNNAMNIATGEYIYFVDSDDYLGANSLSHMYSTAKFHNLDICSPDRPYLTDRPIEFISALPGWCCFIRRSLLTNNGMSIRQPAIRSGQDGVFANMALTQCRTAMVCKDAKYHYEIREDSTFNSLKKDLSVLPGLVEQHLRVLRYFYSLNNLFDTQVDRYLLFLQDETYKFRYKSHLRNFSKKESDHIYLAIKSELISKVDRISSQALPYFSNDFLAITSMTSEEHRGIYA